MGEISEYFIYGKEKIKELCILPNITVGIINNNYSKYIKIRTDIVKILICKKNIVWL